MDTKNTGQLPALVASLGSELYENRRYAYFELFRMAQAADALNEVLRLIDANNGDAGLQKRVLDTIEFFKVNKGEKK